MNMLSVFIHLVHFDRSQSEFIVYSADGEMDVENDSNHNEDLITESISDIEHGWRNFQIHGYFLKLIQTENLFISSVGRMGLETDSDGDDIPEPDAAKAENG